MSFLHCRRTSDGTWDAPLASGLFYILHCESHKHLFINIYMFLESRLSLSHNVPASAAWVLGSQMSLGKFAGVSSYTGDPEPLHTAAIGTSAWSWTLNSSTRGWRDGSADEGIAVQAEDWSSDHQHLPES